MLAPASLPVPAGVSLPSIAMPTALTTVATAAWESTSAAAAAASVSAQAWTVGSPAYAAFCAWIASRYAAFLATLASIYATNLPYWQAVVDPTCAFIASTYAIVSTAISATYATNMPYIQSGLSAVNTAISPATSAGNRLFMSAGSLVNQLAMYAIKGIDLAIDAAAPYANPAIAAAVAYIIDVYNKLAASSVVAIQAMYDGAGSEAAAAWAYFARPSRPSLPPPRRPPSARSRRRHCGPPPTLPSIRWCCVCASHRPQVWRDRGDSRDCPGGRRFSKEARVVCVCME